MMVNTYTSQDAEERDAKNISSSLSAQSILGAARLTRMALDAVRGRLNPRGPQTTDLEKTVAQQKAADLIAVTTERYGELQADGGKAFETERYRFSVSPEGRYQVQDKDYNDWTVYKFLANRDVAQAKVADLSNPLSAQPDRYTPEAASAIAEASVDELLNGLDTPLAEAAETGVLESNLNGSARDEFQGSSSATPVISMPMATPARTLEPEATESSNRPAQPLPVNSNPDRQPLAALFAGLVEQEGQSITTPSRTAPVLHPEADPQIRPPKADDLRHALPYSRSHSEPSAPESDPSEESSSSTTAALADDLVEAAGVPVPPPTRVYASEGFNILQTGNAYDVQDKDGHSLFAFSKDGNQYRILEDRLTSEQRQQFVRAYDTVRRDGLDSILGDPTGNRQIQALGELAPEGSQAIAFTHQQLSELEVSVFQTDHYTHTKGADDSIVITDLTDGRVVAASSAEGRITANLTPQEAQTYSQAYQNMVQAQLVRHTPQAPVQGPSRQPVDLER